MIVVTGASRGLGRALAEFYRNQGEEVLGLARQENHHENIRACDVSDYQSVKDTVKWLKQEKKQVDVLINAAGLASMNLAITTPESVTRKLIEVNLMGTIFCNQLFAPVMIRAGKGKIINFSTIAVKLALKGESIYVASKSGVEGFTRTFAREVSDFGISVNAIAPGPVKTDLLKGISDEQIKAITDQQIFTQTMGIDDVVSVTNSLVQGSHFITGQIIHVGGA